MDEVVILLESGWEATGTPVHVDPDEVSLLAQATEVDGVMLCEVTLRGPGGERTLPFLFVPYSRVVGGGVAQAGSEEGARDQLSFLVQGVRKALYSSRGARESVRSVENE